MYYLKPDPAQARLEAYQDRSRLAIRRARWVFWFAAIAGFTAIWQDKALAPTLHNGMMFVYELGGTLLEGSEATRSYVQNALSISSDGGGGQKYNAITRWLLDNRN